jgi:hypothetical protein
MGLREILKEVIYGIKRGDDRKLLYDSNTSREHLL